MGDRYVHLVVAGSRDLTDAHYPIVRDAIDRWCAALAWPANLRIVEGGARGADALAAFYCQARRVPHLRIHASWAEHGKAAGPKRNQRMIDMADGLVVVRYPDSRGSADVLRRARAAGIPIEDVVLERGGT